METPLLALTRQRAGPSDTVAAENMRQLIQLRWIAVTGQLVTILTVGWGLSVPLPMAPMLATVALLAIANLTGTLTLHRHRITNSEVMAALIFDMGALTFQLYLSGGATNPFIALYLLQVVLGAVLLEAWSAWTLVGVASLCYALLSFSYLPLHLPDGMRAESAYLYRLGDWLGFAMAGVLLVLFIARISRNLRARDAYLADLRQRAAEEDGIVRMGLFASGAAHELGTPLASLSVILADWRRLPRIASDPELAQEVAEMEGEVLRCKAIVTDILHSAGEPRGEAMESRAAQAFLDDVVSGWRQAHGTVPLDYSSDVGRALLVADPALRQAIWNLLDNAAEASLDYVGLTVRRQDDQLIVAVTDSGAGFATDRLAAIGRPNQSSKGAGHGIGLFLASNVARRLGGRLEAANLDEGGAEVRLILPLIGGAT